LFLPSFDPGGSERQMIELARRLDRRRWQVHLACFDATGAWYERAAARAASIAAFPLPRLAHPATLVQAHRFARWCRRRRIAIVHTGQLYPNIFGAPAAALGGVAIRIASHRNLNADKTRDQRHAQRWAMRFAHCIVANSGAAAAQLRAEGIPAGRIVTIPNGIDPEAFPHIPYRTPPRVVVVVANMRAVKGHDILVRAAPLVLERFPDARFLLVGDGPLMPRVKSLVARHGVAHAFVFAGYREDVAAQLASADIFVLPSRSESTPNALLEAMASGLPSVASAVGGVSEIVDDGRTGLLVRPEDPVALARRICQVMASSTLARELGIAARVSVTARYSIDRMIESFEELYEHELAARRSTAGSG
jgi:glycosyltransferase involved in cell wall biosynthesis